MKKIGFVIPWYGEDIPGGAEMELRGLVHHLKDAGMELEILTTCVKEFTSDWNVNYHRDGLTDVNGIAVRRFKVRKRDTQAFDGVNTKLMNGQMLTKDEEQTFVREMVNSDALYEYMEKHKDEYGLYVFIPYMFGTTYHGSLVCPQKTVLIPCFHDETYIYMRIFREAYSKVAGIIYNARPEYDLMQPIYDLEHTEQEVIGVGMDTDIRYDKERFYAKYDIRDPFIVYAGRKDEGKNIYTLIRYFEKYKERIGNNLKLVLIGGGKVEIPDGIKGDVHDLGFVDRQDKYDIIAASQLLCQPSKNESFSIVIMESWLCGRPALVHQNCEVTKHFVQDSNGGLYFSNYMEFEGCINYILTHPEEAEMMGENGCHYVKEHFDWPVVVKKYQDFFKRVIEKYQ
ncbi:MAG TPA: glycosyltransferase family 4 protein [Candidatus Onthocola gallistercoris]|uniref:Glycosyltransferase family 4 protein n=1 Tax=Candidatus Onthocola gallistercoris TaxID=2840876 RepID=A0A9D1HGH0_9FIRM|nr:glycosyltransferase family 4 protein [Candidatus Onthocola gallistercoris]